MKPGPASRRHYGNSRKGIARIAMTASYVLTTRTSVLFSFRPSMMAPQPAMLVI